MTTAEHHPRPAHSEGETYVSPNDVFDAAKNAFLNGRAPETKNEWYIVTNFIAANIAPEAVPLVLMLFDCPLSDGEVAEIILFQWIVRNE